MDDRLRRARVEAALGSLAGALAVVTLFWPAWIEMLIDVDLDGGSGAIEWLVVAALVGVSVSLGLATGYQVGCYRVLLASRLACQRHSQPTPVPVVRRPVREPARRRQADRVRPGRDRRAAG
jgi:hypothetical protein